MTAGLRAISASSAVLRRRRLPLPEPLKGAIVLSKMAGIYNETIILGYVEMGLGSSFPVRMQRLWRLARRNGQGFLRKIMPGEA